VEATLARPIDFEALLDFCISKSLETQKGDFILEGFAATSDLDLQGDVITPSAIKESAKDLEKNSTVLDNHDPNKRVGVVLKSEARPGGLWIQVRISETVPDIRKQIEEGVLNKFSIKRQVIEAEPRIDRETQRRILIIHKMYLTHVATVSVPANTEARSLNWYIVKAIGGEIMPEETKPEEKDTSAGKEPELEKTDTPVPAGDVTPAAPETTPAETTPAETAPAASPQTETPPEVEKAKDDTTQMPTETKPTETPAAPAAPEVVEPAQEDLILKAELTPDGYRKVVALLDKILANLGDKAMVTTLIQQIKAMLGRVSGAAAQYPYPQPVAKAEETPPPAPAAPEVPAETKPDDAAVTDLKKTVGDVVNVVSKVAEVVGEMQKMMPGSSMRKGKIETGGTPPAAPAKQSTDVMENLRGAVDDMLKGR